MEISTNTLIMAAVLAIFFGFRIFRKLKIKRELPSLLEKGAVIVDVRTSAEYARGHAKNSLNIPLADLQNQIKQIGAPDRPVVVCCASGTRSAMAARILKTHGFTQVVNAGSWSSLT